MRIARYLIPLLILIALIVSLSWLAFKPATHEASSRAAARADIHVHDDGPWDPGDERDPHPRPHTKSVGAKIQNATFITDKRDGDAPWDPGDVGSHRRGGKDV